MKLINISIVIAITIFIQGCHTSPPPDQGAGYVCDPMVIYIPVPSSVPVSVPSQPTENRCGICLQRYNNDLTECVNFASSASSVEIQDSVTADCLTNKGWKSTGKPCDTQCEN